MLGFEIINFGIAVRCFVLPRLTTIQWIEDRIMNNNSDICIWCVVVAVGTIGSVRYCLHFAMAHGTGLQW